MVKHSIYVKARVTSNIKIAPHYYKLILHIGAGARDVQPGQFFTIRCSDGSDPLLRRPFSVHRVRKYQSIEMLYEVVGKATEMLSKKRLNDRLDVIGPLGNGFPLNPPHDTRHLLAEGGRTLLIAGGMGVAPLLALADSLSFRAGDRQPTVLIGAKTKRELLCVKDFKRLGCTVLYATEDGSKGKKGLATDLLKDVLSTIDHRPSTIYACGPNAMLHEIGRIAAEKRIATYGSFEEHMACGVGSCYGCAIRTKSGYQRVCHDGPVFDLREIIW